ncbi:AAA family ATPase [Schleiferilactobacillus harbinensis]|uniref:AAA family ATPase n=1 Tax=Schleiferilactobacillus harbinensis TaxID=304207 RepID=UPI0039E86C0C
MASNIFELIGVSGAGKTTWAKEQKHVVDLSSDAIRDELCKQAGIYPLYDQPPAVVKRTNAQVFAVLHARLEAALRANREKIIIDATNLNRARRTALYKRVKLLAPTCRVFAIVFPTPPLPELVRRVTHRGIHDVPAAGLAAQLAAFEAPEQFVDCDHVIQF